MTTTNSGTNAAQDSSAPVPADEREAVARAIWNMRREDEDRCDLELEDMGSDHSVWKEADAAIAVLVAWQAAHQAAPAQPSVAPTKAVGFHVIYDRATSVDYRATEREAHAHARELVENGWLDVNVRSLIYAVQAVAPTSDVRSTDQQAGAVAWMIWLHGPAGVFENKDDAILELERRNRLLPKEAKDRKLLELRSAPDAIEQAGAQPVALTDESIKQMLVDVGPTAGIYKDSRDLSFGQILKFARAIEHKVRSVPTPATDQGAEVVSVPIKANKAIRDVIRGINSDSGEGWKREDEDGYWQDLLDAAMAATPVTARRATVACDKPPSSECASLPVLLDKVADIIELYAESYDTMARMNGGDNKVSCTCVAVDLRQNISKQVCAAIAEQVEQIRHEAVEADRASRKVSVTNYGDAVDKSASAAQGVKTLIRCAAGRDGDCSHPMCPQARDGEPHKSQRHCPLDTLEDDE